MLKSSSVIVLHFAYNGWLLCLFLALCWGNGMYAHICIWYAENFREGTSPFAVCAFALFLLGAEGPYWLKSVTRERSSSASSMLRNSLPKKNHLFLRLDAQILVPLKRDSISFRPNQLREVLTHLTPASNLSSLLWIDSSVSYFTSLAEIPQTRQM